jgi:hypothetical protein
MEANIGAADVGYTAALKPISEIILCNWKGLTEISSLKPWGRILISLKENVPDGHLTGAIVNLCKALLVNEAAVSRRDYPIPDPRRYHRHPDNSASLASLSGT